MKTILRYIRNLAAVESRRNLADAELLRRFIDERDEAAFAALVDRHGPMVLSACRRVLRNDQDAEDVLQGTYLVLARRANSIRRFNSVGSWLYGVAYRLALKMRAKNIRQRRQEEMAGNRTRADDEVTSNEVSAILDEELQRLPEKYRVPLLLCCLEGKSRDEAAVELG